MHNLVDLENEVDSSIHSMIQHNFGVVHKRVNIFPFHYIIVVINYYCSYIIVVLGVE